MAKCDTPGCKRHRRRGFYSWVGTILWKRKRATHSGILAWKTPWTEEPKGRQESDTTEQSCTHTQTSLYTGLVRAFRKWLTSQPAHTLLGISPSPLERKELFLPPLSHHSAAKWGGGARKTSGSSCRPSDGACKLPSAASLAGCFTLHWPRFWLSAGSHSFPPFDLWGESECSQPACWLCYSTWFRLIWQVGPHEHNRPLQTQSGSCRCAVSAWINNTAAHSVHGEDGRRRITVFQLRFML